MKHRLGVAGTLTGAAVASVVSGVGAAVYGRSLLVTRRQVTRARRLVRPAGDTCRCRHRRLRWTWRNWAMSN